ncbi:glycosyl hydrolase family 10 [Fusarium oxysporum f. sp. pisi HDV247]|uniref:Beta-xylanase n=1 Tax=Fusarium oxysporum f. sp. pisi HDV247 TaxID=1080344 RepID=W9NF24_FUSOX|nr:glycosyl hydrolase family 10 [Fusarium oxysporum f. sp. pisi HDV247]
MRLTTIIATFVAFAGAISIPSTGTTSLREEATTNNLLLGSGAINPSYLNDPQFRAVLSKQFNSLSPENELKWTFVHPAKCQYDWHKLDRLVKFADANNMKVKGHGLLSPCCNPDYLLNITSPEALRAEITNHFEAIMHRYRGKMDRWDVVSEALKTNGSGLAPNHFYDTLGPGWVEDAFRIARAADPDAKLFLNENLVEVQPKKRQELYDMVSALVHKGVPIDGIALQMHITLEPLVPGVIREMVESYRAIGLQVTIAEMDVHTYNATQQAEIYGDTVKEALDAGITDISFWGFTDKHLYTWLPGAKPLMFNETYYPKSAFYSTHSVLADFNERL